MNHLALLGDSIFDNAAYVSGGPDVRAHLARILSPDWRVTLLAVDGSQADDVADQIARLPGDASHVIVSAGGNDALNCVGLLNAPASSMRDAVDRLATVGEQFRARYRRMLRNVLASRRTCAICTIYEPRFPDPVTQRGALIVLGIFNDVIMYEAAAAGVPCIELRLVCTEETDYANPIEPSATGGAKIANAIARTLGKCLSEP